MTPSLWLVHLWAPPAVEARLVARLEPAARERIARLMFPALRMRQAVAHVALRTVASRQLGVPFASLRWGAGRYGKPFLEGAELELNMTHSGDWAMIAVGPRYPVGVDLEAIVPERAGPSMVRAVTSSAERAAFARLPAHEHAIAFFRLWVRKEAVIKAFGTGLSRELSTIDVPLDAAAAPDGLVLRPSPEPGLRWWLWDVPAPLGYLAALVVGQPEHEAPQPPGPLQSLTLADLDPEAGD